MKLFLIKCDVFDYDQYDSLVIAAHSPLEAVKMTLAGGTKITTTDNVTFEYETDEKPSHIGDGYFKKGQSPLTVKEIDVSNIKKSKIILSSFNAG